MNDKVNEWASLKTNVKDALGRFLYEQTRRRPMILTDYHGSISISEQLEAILFNRIHYAQEKDRFFVVAAGDSRW